jgi:hypothetical protein
MHKFGPLMVRVGSKTDQTISLHFIRQPLHRLAGQAHVPGDMRNRQRHRRQSDRTQHLPARARQTNIGNQRIACSEQATVQPKRLQDQIRQSCYRAGLHDNILSYCLLIVNMSAATASRP